jgi:hypothetical protein
MLPISEEDAFQVTKDWYKRRLRDRWTCNDRGHSLCFKHEESNVHFALSNEDVNEWVETMACRSEHLAQLPQRSLACRKHNGYATQLRPPKAVLTSHLPDRGSDIDSIHSSTSFTRYKRRGHFWLNPNLRSTRDSLVASSASSSTIRGIGYLSGNAIEWTGDQIISGIQAMDCSWRLWTIRRTVSRLQKMPESQLGGWISERAVLISHHLDELLDLTQYSVSRSPRELLCLTLMQGPIRATGTKCCHQSGFTHEQGSMSREYVARRLVLAATSEIVSSVSHLLFPGQRSDDLIFT